MRIAPQQPKERSAFPPAGLSCAICGAFLVTLKLQRFSAKVPAEQNLCSELRHGGSCLEDAVCTLCLSKLEHQWPNPCKGWGGDVERNGVFFLAFSKYS